MEMQPLVQNGERFDRMPALNAHTVVTCKDKGPNDSSFVVPRPSHVFGRRKEVFA
jgi:hypothetical protein